MVIHFHLHFITSCFSFHQFPLCCIVFLISKLLCFDGFFIKFWKNISFKTEPCSVIFFSVLGFSVLILVFRQYIARHLGIHMTLPFFSSFLWPVCRICCLIGEQTYPTYA